MHKRLLTAVAALALAAVLVMAVAASAGAAARGPLTFSLTISKTAAKAPLTGRAYVIVSKSNEDEPRFQLDVTGAPFWGKDVSAAKPGKTFVVSDRRGAYGYPLRQMRSLPAGVYYVQAFFNVYTRFSRSDGSVVWLHMPGGDGQDPFSSPGNLYSAVKKVRLDPARTGTVKLVLDRVIQPAEPVPPGGTTQQGNPADSAHVKHLKVKSALLSAFWGTDMYIASDVLLPEGYDPSVKYPIVYLHGHYPSGNPYSFKEDLSNDFSEWWVAADTPRMIVAQFRHENPYYDDSYAVNSANLGPYGDAITQELMPAVESQFSVIGERWARAITGGSTGGWEALAQMVFYPDLYQSVWVRSPDPVDFRYVQLVNIYDMTNAYWDYPGWLKIPRPAARAVDGMTLWTMDEENHFELALGTHGRSGLGQWDIWQAVYGPRGADGYPAPIWDKQTGAIDHTVAEAWKPMDLSLYLRANWADVGPKLANRLHIFAGDDDNYFLNDAVELLEEFLDGTTDPAANADVRYGHNKGHGWWPYTFPELLTHIYDSMQAENPNP